jgi:MIP family channel proteins
LYFSNHISGEKMFNSKVFLAEFIGTFALVFVGASASIVTKGDLVGTAIAYGLTLAVFVYVYGHISGSHLNPAVTFGLALNGTVKWMQAIFYWLAQFTGAILAMFFLKTLLEPLGADISKIVTSGILTESQPIMGMVLEAILTFFLVNTILHTMVENKSHVFASWAIGATLAFATLVGFLFTGDAMNPARTLAAAIFSAPSLTSVYTYVVYFFGPLLGATLAVIVSNFLNDSAEEIEDDAEDVEEV